MHFMYATSNELLNYGKFGYMFSDYFIYIRGEKETAALKPIDIVTEKNLDINPIAERLSPFLSSANIIVKISLNEELIENSPVYFLPIIAIQSLIVRNDDEKTHLSALIKDTVLEKIPVQIDEKDLDAFRGPNDAKSSEDEPFIHPLLRILDGLTGGIHNLLHADFSDFYSQQVFKELLMFPPDVHQAICEVLTDDKKADNSTEFLLYENLKKDLDFLLKNTRIEKPAWFETGKTYNQYYAEQKLYEQYLETTGKPDLVIAFYLGQILLTRIALGESGKKMILTSMISLLEKLETKKSIIKQGMTSIQRVADSSINRDELEGQIKKAKTLKSPTQKSIYLFFKYFDRRDLMDLSNDLEDLQGEKTDPFAWFLPFLYHGFLTGFSGLRPNLKQKTVRENPSILIWPLHILNQLAIESKPQLFQLPKALSIAHPFTLCSTDGIIKLSATERMNPVLTINARKRKHNLDKEIQELETRLEKLRNKQEQLINSKILFNASLQRKNKKAFLQSTLETKKSIVKKSKKIANIHTKTHTKKRTPKEEATGDLFPKTVE